jgi:N-methylhydantoinase B
LTEQMFEASRRAAMVALGQLPRGEFRGRSVFIDDAPEGIADYPVQVCVTIGGPTVIIDFTGSAPQNDSMMNSPLAATAAAALTTVLMLLGPDVAHDEGVLRLFEVRASSGSMLNAEFPAATYGGNKMCEFIGSAIMAAFAQALPDRICAEWSRRLSLRAAGRDPRTGKDFLEIFFLTYAGGGAVQGVDGYDQPGLMSGGNVLHQDYEFMELRTPLTLWKHEYLRDSAGRGQWRGGLGNETVMELRGQHLTFVCHGGGTTEAAQGILGGEPGCLNLLEITDATGQVRQAHAREKIGPLVPPVMLRQISGGGGGYGPAAQRDPGAQAYDVAAGLVSEPSMQPVSTLEHAA